jgi:hypothetical protein
LSRRKWTSKDLAFLRANYSRLTLAELAAHLDRSSASIALAGSRSGFSDLKQPGWTRAEDELLLANSTKGVRRKLKELSALFPRRTTRAISARLAHLGIKSGKYTFDRHFFEPPNVQNSYWAGVLAADGDIQDNRVWVSLKVQRTDRVLIERFARATAFSGPIYDYESATDERTGKRYLSSQVRVYGCSEWIRDLQVLWNISNRKSLTLQAPSASHSFENCLAYVIGLIDGDGSIALVAGKYLRLQMSGTRAILQWAASILEDIVPSTGRRATVRDNREMCDFIVTGRRAVKLLQVLKAVSVEKMDRKWNKVPAG